MKNNLNDLGNIKSKVNETCYCETCHTVKMRKRMRDGADPRSGCGTDMGIKGGRERIWG